MVLVVSSFKGNMDILISPQMHGTTRISSGLTKPRSDMKISKKRSNSDPGDPGNSNDLHDSVDLGGPDNPGNSGNIDDLVVLVKDTANGSHDDRLVHSHDEMCARKHR